jgi:16S rRNA (adenine1518-N6/adenine1519-N6)-dimethyltransferase
MYVRPKKHLGQHFLTDMRAAERIVAQLTPAADEVVLEIGPGKGVLTKLLVELGYPTQAVEYDAEAAAYLRQNLIAPNFTLVEGDFMAVELPREPIAIIGNLPYNLTSPILFRVIYAQEQIREGVFMVQREVAQRICTPPGKRECGILSVLMAHYYELQYCFTVPPGAFFPPPKVHSAVFRFTRRASVPELPKTALIRVVKAAFSQRRKTLRNSLNGLIPNLPTELGELRAEALSLDQFRHLVALYATAHPNLPTQESIPNDPI